MSQNLRSRSRLANWIATLDFERAKCYASRSLSSSSMHTSADRVRFDPFELDLSSSELRKGPTRLKVPYQSIEILKALLERPGELVTRDELRQRLWPSNTVVDFEHGLNAAIRRLREALGDSADSPRFVETLPKRGYRFIGEIDPSRHQHEQRPTRPARSRTRRCRSLRCQRARSKRGVWGWPRRRLSSSVLQPG